MSVIQLLHQHLKFALPADNQVTQRIEDGFGYCELMALEGFDHGTCVDIIETHTFIVATCHNVILYMPCVRLKCNHFACNTLFT